MADQAVGQDAGDRGCRRGHVFGCHRGSRRFRLAGAIVTKTKWKNGAANGTSAAVNTPPITMAHQSPPEDTARPGLLAYAEQAK